VAFYISSTSSPTTTTSLSHHTGWWLWYIFLMTASTPLSILGTTSPFATLVDENWLLGRIAKLEQVIS
jgi:hypothetical protein